MKDHKTSKLEVENTSTDSLRDKEKNSNIDNVEVATKRKLNCY